MLFKLEHDGMQPPIDPMDYEHMLEAATIPSDQVQVEEHRNSGTFRKIDAGKTWADVLDWADETGVTFAVISFFARGGGSSRFHVYTLEARKGRTK